MSKLLLALGIMLIGMLTVAFGGVVPLLLIAGFIVLKLWHDRKQ